MSAQIQAFFESRKTAILAMIFSGLLWLTGEGVDVQLADWTGWTLATADKITDVAKFLTTIIAALGWSPLPRPVSKFSRATDNLPLKEIDPS